MNDADAGQGAELAGSWVETETRSRSTDNMLRADIVHTVTGW